MPGKLKNKVDLIGLCPLTCFEGQTKAFVASLKESPGQASQTLTSIITEPIPPKADSVLPPPVGTRQDGPQAEVPPATAAFSTAPSHSPNVAAPSPAAANTAANSRWSRARAGEEAQPSERSPFGDAGYDGQG